MWACCASGVKIILHVVVGQNNLTVQPDAPGRIFFVMKVVNFGLLDAARAAEASVFVFFGARLDLGEVR